VGEKGPVLPREEGHEGELDLDRILLPNVLTLMPPLIIEAGQLEGFLSALSDCLNELENA